MKIINISLILTCLLLQGCDFEGGLKRFAKIEGEPFNKYCVNKALKNVQGISNVRYVNEGNSHRFDYVVKGIDNKLIYEDLYYNDTNYWNEYSFLNASPKCEDVKKIHPYLLKIDKSIEKECDTNISKYIDESLIRMTCE